MQDGRHDENPGTYSTTGRCPPAGGGTWTRPRPRLGRRPCRPNWTPSWRRPVGNHAPAARCPLPAARCAEAIAAGVVEIRDGSAEHTGCADRSMDAMISVNNVMLWDRRAGLTEAYRVLQPGGRLAIAVHRHVLNTTHQSNWPMTWERRASSMSASRCVPGV
ncbi:class I SAM-dependent methyltransferase [Micromonospora sp. CPCC 205547]|uniref:class I SAM-dependent methyltransferase n=1 Tax=Micromonospora sp. CPCC 205547 TaxID=3122400 RepID=UPI003B9697F9